MHETICKSFCASLRYSAKVPPVSHNTPDQRGEDQAAEPNFGQHRNAPPCERPAFHVHVCRAALELAASVVAIVNGKKLHVFRDGVVQDFKWFVAAPHPASSYS